MDKKLGYDPTGIGRIGSSGITISTGSNALYIHDIHEPARIGVYNLAGQLVAGDDITHDISYSLPGGTYIIRLTDIDSMTESVKCIIPN